MRCALIALLVLAACGRTALDAPPPEATAPQHCTAESCGQALTSGLDHSCQLIDGEAWCWGFNREGQLGVAPVDATLEPQRVVFTERLVQIVAGDMHTCALTARGEVWCWGSDRFGQLGSGLYRPTDISALRERPARVEGLPAIARLEIGEVKTCGLTASEERWCWGGYRQAAPVARAAPPPSYEPVMLLHGCLVTAQGGVQCWGNNHSGELGRAMPRDESKVLVTVPGLPPHAVQVVTPMTGSCALFEGGKVWCWGGWPTPIAPTQVSGLTDVATLRYGFVYVCGMTSAGRVGCVSASAQLEPYFFPYDDIEDFTVGAWKACVQRKGGEVWCVTGADADAFGALARVEGLPPRKS